MRTKRRLQAWTCTYLLTLGLVVLLGGPARLSGRSFAGARSLAAATGTDPRVAWGVPLLAAGSLLAAGVVLHSPGLRVAGYSLAAVWALFFAFGVALAARNDPAAGLTGVVTYVFVAGIAIILARGARY